jgi:hypothetical protein
VALSQQGHHYSDRLLATVNSHSHADATRPGPGSNVDGSIADADNGLMRLSCEDRFSGNAVELCQLAKQKHV